VIEAAAAIQAGVQVQATLLVVAVVGLLVVLVAMLGSIN
jgi:hypothetical protein